MKYEAVAAVFQEKGCQLLSTKEEVEKNHSGKVPKFNYIAKCGHEHIVFYNVFISRRGTGILCPNCVIKESSIKGKDRFKNDKTQTMKLEKRCIDYFIDLIQDEFECIQAFDGCSADLILRPLSVQEDEWIGIQVKSTAFKNMDYGFHLNKKKYDDMLILCMCWEDKRTWIVPFEDVMHLTKLTIGLKKSKYDIYEFKKEDAKQKLHAYYSTSVKKPFESLDTPICTYQQREKLFRQLRESKIKFLEFTYSNVEAQVFDFLCEGLKVQEKVGGISKQGYIFHLYKNNGKNTDKIRTFISYTKGDNDFYWLHLQDKKHFYVIPENILIDRNKVNTPQKESLYIIHNKKDVWYSEYMFDYDNIDIDKLSKMFKKDS